MITENIWEKARLNQARRERVRLIKAKRITFNALPNVLTLVDGIWKFPSPKET